MVSEDDNLSLSRQCELLSVSQAFNALAQIADVGYDSLICQTKENFPLTKSANTISVWEI
jgi:hypothetical protein